MRLTIVSDKTGKIISLTRPGDVGDTISGIMKAGIVAVKGQTVHEIDIPKELEKTDLLEIHKRFKVNPKKRTLVKV